MNTNNRPSNTDTQSTSSSKPQTKTRPPVAGVEKDDQEPDTKEEQTTCPECDGKVINNPQKGETHCEDCGIVIEENEIDHGPEWRQFNEDQTDNKRRVGSPSTESLHDKGLSTNISWKDKDSRGNNLSAEQKHKFKRLRKRNKQSKTDSGKDKILRQGLTEINRMSSSLGFPNSTTETASMIFRQAQKKDVLDGRCMEGVATACLYIAAQKEQIPRSLTEFEQVSRVNRKRIARSKTKTLNYLGLEVKPTHPKEYIPRFGSKVDASQDQITEAIRLSEIVIENGIGAGKSPTTLAGAAIYAAGLKQGEEILQKTIDEKCPTTGTSLRKNYKLFLAHDPELDITLEELNDMFKNEIKNKVRK